MESGGFDPSNRFLAPDFKRRQLLFDSFSKLQQKSVDASGSGAIATTNNAASAASSAAAAAKANAASSSAAATASAASTDPSAAASASGASLLVADGGKGTLLYGWGAGYHGQLGLNTARKKCRLQPSCIDLHEPVQMVACGGFHTAVLTDDGRVYTWGDGRLGQLGNLQRKHNMHSTPRLVDYLVSYKVQVAYIACGQYHTAAVANSGRLFTWGSGKWGQLGHGVRQDERFPRKVDTEKALGNFVRVACGDRHTAVLNEQGGIVTFGNGQHGQLGHGNGLDCLKPTLLTQGDLAQHRIVALDCGATTTAAVTETGALYLWGFGESLHPKGVSNVLEAPRQVRMREAVKQVACGLGHVLVLTEAGDVYSFGVASMGQIGHGTRNSVRNPRLVLRGKEVYQIAAGRYHSMAVSNYGVVYAWGCSESGQTGVNLSLENEYLPRIIDALLPNVVGHISCGEHHSLAVTSIPHNSVAPDVQHWKSIEDSELALKRAWLKETPNGLKSKHILLIESERAGIIAQLADNIRRDAEEKQRAASEKMSLITPTEQLMASIQKQTQRRQSAAANSQHATSSAHTSAAVQALEADGIASRTTDDEAGSGGMSSSAIRAIEAQAMRLATSGQAESKESSAEWNDEDEDEEELAAKKRRAKRLQQLMDMKSTPASATASRARSPARSPAANSPRGEKLDSAEEEKEAMVVYDGQSSIDTRPTTTASSRVRFPPVHRPQSAVNQDAGSGNSGSSNNSTVALSSSPSSSPTPAAVSDVGFAPLAPRIQFIEQTTKTLARVKSFMSNTVIPAEGNYVSDLIRVKKQYNALKAERQRLEKQHRLVSHDLALTQPNEDEQLSASVQAEQLRQLNMKLVTLNTRLMEAEENKKNYELYIIRMKEEDLQLGKQIDHLRSICAEYSRLLSKLEKMNRRVGAQRLEVQDETVHFVHDVQQFMAFADSVVSDYRRVLNASYKQSLYQEQLFHQRAERQERARSDKVEALKQTFAVLQQQQAELKTEMDGWDEKVESYEKRFRKVAAATGLTRAEQIISKFYFNDEITQDLNREIAGKERTLTQLRSVRAQLQAALTESSQTLAVSKWKDVSEAEEKCAEAALTLSRQSEECDKWTHRLTQVVEGMTQLANKVQQRMAQAGGSGQQLVGASAEEQEDEEAGEDDRDAASLEAEERRLNGQADKDAEVEQEDEEEAEEDDEDNAGQVDPSAIVVTAPSAAGDAQDADSDSEDVDVLDVSRLMNEVAIATAANIAALSQPHTSLDTASPTALAALSPSRHRAELPRYPSSHGRRHTGSTTSERAVRNTEARMRQWVDRLLEAVSEGKQQQRERATRRAAVASAQAEKEELAARTEQLQQMLLNPRKNIWDSVQEKVEINGVDESEVQNLREKTGSA